MRISVRVRPGASRTSVGRSYDGALVVRVQERAVDGAATAAVLRAVGQSFGVRTADITLVSGSTSRSKVLEVPGDHTARLAELLGEAREPQ